MAVLKLKNEITNEWEDVITIKGDKGDKPTHEIDGTKIRFQNPDGKWGEWIELEVLTAEHVPTSDGSDVQSKLDNSFSLGSAPNGTPYEQNDYGFVPLEDENLDTKTRSNLYYCKNCINRPTSHNGWLQVLGGGTNVKQVYHLLGTSTQTSFARTMIDGVWGMWKLVTGTIQLYSSTTGTANGSDLTTAYNMTMFGAFVITLNGYDSSFLHGRGTGSNVRASCTDIARDSATSITMFSAVLTYSKDSNVVNVARAYLTIVSATTQPITARNVVGIIGLP